MKNITEYNSNTFLSVIRTSKWTKVIAVLLVAEMLTGNIVRQNIFALTSGPSQPEATTFQQADMSTLVDPFSGDFSYDIPIMEIGGYPINLSYGAGISMDQEATWAGLGWNVNTGAIVRNLRGLPDDFNGDEIERNYSIKPNETWGVNVGLGLEFFGKPGEFGVNGGVALGFDVLYNNYTGYSITESLNPTLGVGTSGKSSLTAGLGMSSSSGEGFTLTPSLSYSNKTTSKSRKNIAGGINFGIPMNSRTGLRSMSFSGSLTATFTKPYAPAQELANNLTASRPTNLSQNAVREAAAKVSYFSSIETGWKAGGKFGSTINFSGPTYSPPTMLPFKNTAITFSAKIGLAAQGADPIDVIVGGHHSVQKLDNTHAKYKSYGYLNSENGQNVEDAMHDFSREKDAPFSPKTTTMLPLTNYSYDIFQIQAQGLGGSIRPFRNDASYIHDYTTNNTSTSFSLGLEYSAGSLYNAGIDPNVVSVNTKNGQWTKDNTAKNNMAFSARTPGQLNEKGHMRLAGEKTVDSDANYFTSIGGNKAVAFRQDGLMIKNALAFKGDDAGSDVPFNGSITRANRQNRGSSVEYLTFAEVKSLYPQRYQKYYSHPSLVKNIKGHHIAQITVVKPDGSRYVFGLAAYNFNQQEVTFSIGVNPQNPVALGTPNANNNIEYIKDYDNTTANNRGIDNSYDMTKTPSYVYTWHLTEVLSADYVDVTGDGPTEDDLGNYTSFEYGVEIANGKNYPNIVSYSWRTPTDGADMAGYNKNLHTTEYDDDANIVYGTKQIWYVNKIKSKTQVCVFTLSDREDGFGVEDINGERATDNALKKIDKISLYSKEEWMPYEKSGYVSTPPIPVKVVHFAYDYSLCDGIPNSINDGGKLTLKSVWFTYQNTNKSRYNPYTFTYSTVNPSYDATQYDRWGSYKNDDGTLPNNEFPYTEQNKSIADVNASAWCLTQIGLPSGGILNVEYESDDYAYVQNKQACTMKKILGFSNSSGTLPTNDELFPDANHSYNYLFFNLDENVTGTFTEAGQIVKKQYFEGETEQINGPLKYLYFRCYINVGADASKKEYVSGYAEIDLEDEAPIGVIHNQTSGTTWDCGYVKLKGVKIMDKDGDSESENPIAKATWQFSRLQTPMLAFNLAPPAGMDDIPAVMSQLANSFSSVFEFFRGANVELKRDDVGRYFDADKSWIRLLDHDGIKYGGGHRVRRIEINDNWDSMSLGKEDAFTYAVEYSYAKDGKSSGVAAWEPMMGADENPHRIPVFMNKKTMLIPDEQYYIEEPLGESFFPAASVGYSKVTIKNIARSDVNLNASGTTLCEFFTAKDFPTKVEYVPLAENYIRSNTGGSITLIAKIAFDKVIASQGYCVTTNDMHGKLKSETTLNEAGAVVVQKNYEYQTNADGSLNNMADVVMPDGSVENRMIGVDYDFIADMRESRTNIGGGGANVNLQIMPAIPPIPLIIIPTVVPDITIEKTTFRSATITKTIFQSAILKSTTITDKGSIVKTENIAYDGRTGDILITKVNNEYKDARYSVNYPAYWAYDRMGLAADNWGFCFTVPTNDDVIHHGSGQFNPTADVLDVLVPGDEVTPVIYPATPIFTTGATANSNRYWFAVNDDFEKYLIKGDGSIYKPDANVPLCFKVVRSGRRNMPTAVMGQADVLENPISSGNLDIDNLKILNTGAAEYSERWKTKIYRLEDQHYESVTCGANITGLKVLTMLNSLIKEDKFVRGSAPVLNYLDVNLVGFNGSEILPSSYFYTSVVSDYTPTATCASTLGLDNNAWMDLIFSSNSTNPCLSITIQAISLAPQADFTIDDFSHIESFASVINVTDLSIGSAFSYLLDNANDVMILKAKMDDGSIKDFLFCVKSTADNCVPLAIGSACCSIQEDYICNTGLDITNPYLVGVLGNWRPYRSYTYLTQRTPADITGTFDRRTAGHFTFQDGFFWKRTGGLWINDYSNSTYDEALPWARATEITDYNNMGAEVENVNPLGIYSAATYGYKHTLPTMVAQNAKYKEIGFDGFEDYLPKESVKNECVNDHFKLSKSFWDNVVDDVAHTGKKSYLYKHNDTPPEYKYTITNPQSRRTTLGVPYSLEANDLFSNFSPDASVEKKYILSFWVRVTIEDEFETGEGENEEDLTATNATSYDNISGGIKINGIALATQPVKKSPVIDGWQQFEYEFTIPSTTAGTTFDIYFLSEEGDYYIDDIRVQPFNSVAKSFVYNASNLRFMAELDENNYATFYEYDEEGGLVRVKKETERGILTLKENRSRTFKRNP